jgi:Ran GTPase-activating protein (RanGAP) involved in mRNA processing and transport
MVNLSQLVEQVRNNPDDVQTRLVLADAWMEQGNPQGQLMLWTAQREQMRVGDVGYHEMRRKCDSLQEELRASLCEKWGVRHVTFEYGYVVGVEVSKMEGWQQLGTATHGALALLSKIAFEVVANGSLGRWLTHLSSVPALTSLTVGGKLGKKGVKTLAESPCLKNLTSLNLGGRCIGDEGTKVLAASPYLKKLTSLDLGWNMLGKEGAKWLAASPSLENLTSLNLEWNKISVEGAKALAESPYLKNLRLLKLMGNGIGKEGAIFLAESPHLKNLISLNLEMNAIGEEGAKALAGSPYLKNLTSLNLGANAIRYEGVKALSESPHLKKLTSLDLGMNAIGKEGEKALAVSPNLKNLTMLNLGVNAIGDEGAKAFAESPFLGNLNSLNLYNNAIGAEGAKALARSLYLKNLTLLNLFNNEIGEEGAKALAKSPNLKNLTELDLRDNAIRDEGKKALVESPYLKNIDKWDWLSHGKRCLMGTFQLGHGLLFKALAGDSVRIWEQRVALEVLGDSHSATTGSLGPCEWLCMAMRKGAVFERIPNKCADGVSNNGNDNKDPAKQQRVLVQRVEGGSNRKADARQFAQRANHPFRSAIRSKRSYGYGGSGKTREPM